MMYVLFEQDIFRLQIAVYQFRLSEQSQAIDQLLRKHAHQCRGQSTELILLDQFVEIDAQQFEDKAQMLPVNKGILQSQEMVVVILVHLLV